ncbi:hypothetical protein K1719_005320 [Acacia pycnantha]|nr:hypothetical protein K1719_005320 [Acacia pycnantha]
MEGLIPYLIDVIKKQQHKSAPTTTGTYRRSFSHSDTSNDRSYHLLLGSSDSFGGSSHRRTRSDLPPSLTAGAEFSEHRYGKDGFLVSPRDPPPFLSAASSSPTAKSVASSHASRLVSRS